MISHVRVITKSRNSSFRVIDTNQPVVLVKTMLHLMIKISPSKYCKGKRHAPKGNPA